MTIFGYALPEIQKFLLAVAALVIAGAAMLITLDPGFQAAVETLIIAVIGAVAIFAVPNPSTADVNKGLAALTSALVAVIQFYHSVPSSTTTKVIALCYAFATAYVIWRTRNHNVVNSGQRSLRV
jgi:hypothetical protein